MQKRWLKRENVHAIHKRDLETILKDLRLYEKILSESVSCSICGSPINLGNLQCLFMEENQIKFCCTNLKCYNTILLKKKSLNDK